MKPNSTVKLHISADNQRKLVTFFSLTQLFVVIETEFKMIKTHYFPMSQLTQSYLQLNYLIQTEISKKTGN